MTGIEDYVSVQDEKGKEVLTKLIFWVYWNKSLMDCFLSILAFQKYIYLVLNIYILKKENRNRI